jgi:hypothetical protein
MNPEQPTNLKVEQATYLWLTTLITNSFVRMIPYDPFGPLFNM